MKEIDEIELDLENKRLSASNHRWIRKEQDAVRARLLRRLCRHNVNLTASQIEWAAACIFDGRLQHRFAEQRRNEGETIFQLASKVRIGCLPRHSMLRRMIQVRMKVNMKF